MKMKWYTYQEYVDNHTGEMLTSNEVKQNYRIINKIKKHERKQKWVHLRTGTQLREEYGVTTITNICTREGRQIAIW